MKMHERGRGEEGEDVEEEKKGSLVRARERARERHKKESACVQERRKKGFSSYYPLHMRKGDAMV